MPSTSTVSDEPSTSTQSDKPLTLMPFKKYNKTVIQNQVKIFMLSHIEKVAEFDDMSEDEIPEISVVNDDSKAKIGYYVIMRSEGNSFPGLITNLKENEICFSAMEKCGVNWKWPGRKDGLFFMKVPK